MIPKKVGIILCVLFFIVSRLVSSIFAYIRDNYRGDGRFYSGIVSSCISVLFFLGPVSSGISFFVSWSYDNGDKAIVDAVRKTGLRFLIWREVRKKVTGE